MPVPENPLPPITNDTTTPQQSVHYLLIVFFSFVGILVAAWAGWYWRKNKRRSSQGGENEDNERGAEGGRGGHMHPLQDLSHLLSSPPPPPPPLPAAHTNTETNAGGREHDQSARAEESSQPEEVTVIPPIRHLNLSTESLVPQPLESSEIDTPANVASPADKQKSTETNTEEGPSVVVPTRVPRRISPRMEGSVSHHRKSERLSVLTGDATKRYTRLFTTPEEEEEENGTSPSQSEQARALRKIKDQYNELQREYTDPSMIPLGLSLPARHQSLSASPSSGLGNTLVTVSERSVSAIERSKTIIDDDPIKDKPERPTSYKFDNWPPQRTSYAPGLEGASTRERDWALAPPRRVIEQAGRARYRTSFEKWAREDLLARAERREKTLTEEDLQEAVAVMWRRELESLDDTQTSIQGRPANFRA